MKGRTAAILLFCAEIGVALAFSARELHPRISAQKLLREAVRDQGPLEEIFEQQAGQGYYDDALVTARLMAAGYPRLREDALSRFVEDVITIRAANGDIQGAKEMITRYRGLELASRGADATRAIGKVQVDSGDLRGALETSVSAADKDKVMEECGEREIAKGDFDAALQTAEQVTEQSAYDLFYDVGSELRTQGEERRLHELASHMSDRKRAAEFVEAARVYFKPIVAYRIEATPCDIAWHDATIGKFAEAWALAERNKCDNTNVAIEEFAVDPVEAERELHKMSNKNDVSRNLAEMSKAAAKKGDAANALRLFEAAQQVSGKPVPCWDCVQYIAWAWTLGAGPKAALDWARSLPSAQEQRGYALLGVAQALGHAKPEVIRNAKAAVESTEPLPIESRMRTASR